MSVRAIIRMIGISPILMSLKVSIMAAGKRATMPAKMMREMPFPMPRSVICSPSHMMKAVPEVRVMMVMSLKLQPGFCMNAPSAILSRPTAMKEDWITLMITVP